MNWIILSLAGVAIWGANNIIDKIFLEKYIKNSSSATILMGLVGLLVSLSLLVFTGIPEFSTRDFLIIFASGLVLTLFALPYYKSLSLDDASRVVPVFQFIPIFYLLLAYIFLGESLQQKSLVGFLIVLVGSLFIAMEKFDLSIFKIRPSFLFMLLASFMYSVSIVMFKVVAVDNDFWGSILLTYFGTGVGSLLLFLIPSFKRNFISDIVRFKKGVWGVVALNEAGGLTGKLLISLAVIAGPLALVGLVENSQPVFVFIYALLLTKFAPKILKEDFSRESLIIKASSLAIITVGVLLI